MATDTIKFELSEHELEYLEDIHKAQAILEMTRQPGWEHYTEMIKDMIARLENQHLAFSGKATESAYYASGLRLGAAREFAQILELKIEQHKDFLRQPLRAPNPTADLAELDGDYTNGDH